MITSAIIADDSATCRMMTRECLGALGLPAAACREADNGAQVLAALRERGADLLITDLAMPVMDGFELLLAIAQDPRLQGLARIVVSSTAGAAIQTELRHLGVAAVLRKPVSTAALGKVLADLRLPNLPPVSAAGVRRPPTPAITALPSPGKDAP
jgi:CheY-like chemotaxis protein